MLFTASKKKIAWHVIISVIIISLTVVTIEIYSIEEENIKTSVIKNQIKIQEIITQSISKNISSELESIIFELEFLSNSDELQKDIGTAESNQLINKTFSRINTISPTAQILALDENFMVLSQASKNHNSFVGATVKGLPELIKAEKNPVQTESTILSINTLLYDEPEIAITFPIINQQTNMPTGMLLVTFASSEFFERHGNIYDVESQYLTVMDENHILLIHPDMENVGKSFFGDKIQKNIENNSILNQHILNVMEGNLSTVIFTLDKDVGEMINSGIPINVNDKNEFLFAVVTPVQSINQEIDEVIFFAKIQTVFLLLSTITVLMIFLIKRTQGFKKEKLTVIGQLSSNIAHDIRNPLGTIKNAGVIIDKENKGKNEIISRELNRINLSVRRISHQIEEVLNYVRTTPLMLKPHPINQTLQEAVDTLDVPKNIHVVLPQNDVVINFDYEKMLVVFVNILLNAIQSIGEEKGYITISTVETSSDVTIKFENSGPNIPSRDLTHVFDALFTTKLEGTGLGLSSCKNIVEQHKGDMQVTTDPVIFSVRLSK